MRILSDPSKLNGAPVVASVLHEDRSGLFVGDIISELDGVTVKNSAEAAKSVEAALNGWRSGKKQRTLKKATRREFKLKIIRVEESFRRSLQSESLACVASPSKLTVDVDSAILIELLRAKAGISEDQSPHSFALNAMAPWVWRDNLNWPSLRHEWIMDVTTEGFFADASRLSKNLNHLKRINLYSELEQAFVEPLPHVNFFGESMASEIDVEFDKLLAQHDLSFAGHICATTGRFHQDGRPVLNISAFADTLPSRSDWQENLIECFNMKHLLAAVHWIWLEGALRCAHASLAESRWQKLRNLFESSSLSLMYEMSTLKKDKSPEWKYFALVNEASHALTAENGADMWESGVPFMHSGVKLSLADLDCVLKVEDDRAALKINALKETKWPVTEDGFICNPSFPHVMKEAFEIFVEEERAAAATASILPPAPAPAPATPLKDLRTAARTCRN